MTKFIQYPNIDHMQSTIHADCIYLKMIKNKYIGEERASTKRDNSIC